MVSYVALRMFIAGPAFLAKLSVTENWKPQFSFHTGLREPVPQEAVSEPLGAFLQPYRMPLGLSWGP